MPEADKPSKLDMKLAREKLLVDKLDELWDDLEDAARTTCAKLRDKCGDLDAKLNDHSTVIRVTYSEPIQREASFIEHKLEIRLDRKEAKLIAKITRRYSRGTELKPVGRPRSYTIEADIDAAELFFSGGGKRFSAVELAEHEIAEQLVNLKLEP